MVGRVVSRRGSCQWASGLSAILPELKARSSKRKGKGVRRGLDGARTTDRDGQIFRPQDAGLETQVLQYSGFALVCILISAEGGEGAVRCDEPLSGSCILSFRY